MDQDGVIALSNIAESATVSHTDISVLQQAGFFNDIQGTDCASLVIDRLL